MSKVSIVIVISIIIHITYFIEGIISLLLGEVEIAEDRPEVMPSRLHGEVEGNRQASRQHFAISGGRAVVSEAAIAQVHVCVPRW